MLDDEQIEYFRKAFAALAPKTAKPGAVPAKPAENPPEAGTRTR